MRRARQRHTFPVWETTRWCVTELELAVANASQAVELEAAISDDGGDVRHRQPRECG